MMDWAILARDGAIVATGACAIIAILLRLNPRLFRRHFPEELKASTPPLTAAETRLGVLGGLALLVWVAGGMWLSTQMTERSGLGYGGLFLHAFLVGQAMNIADWLIMDELWLGLARGRGLVPTELIARVRFDHRKHATDALRGSVIFAVLAALVAGIVALT